MHPQTLLVELDSLLVKQVPNKVHSIFMVLKIHMNKPMLILYYNMFVITAHISCPNWGFFCPSLVVAQVVVWCAELQMDITASYLPPSEFFLPSTYELQKNSLQSPSLNFSHNTYKYPHSNNGSTRKTDFRQANKHSPGYSRWILHSSVSCNTRINKAEFYSM